MDERTRELSDLLQPSLTGKPARPPYSIQAQLIVAIIGGLFASVALCAASSRRIGALRSDSWIYVPASLAGALAIVTLVAYPDALASVGGTRTLRYAQQILGVGVLGCFYAKHSAIYKALQLVGEDTPNPWGPGVAAVLGSWGTVFALAMLGGWLRV